MSFASSASTLGEIVGFLSLGRGESLTYVGSSSGLPLAVNLGEMVRASVMAEAFPSSPVPPGKTTSYNNSTANKEATDAHRTISLNDLMKHRAEPPNDEMGSQMALKAPRLYKLLDKLVHAKRRPKAKNAAALQPAGGTPSEVEELVAAVDEEDPELWEQVNQLLERMLACLRSGELLQACGKRDKEQSVI